MTAAGMTRAIEISLPEELWELLDAKAQSAGLDREAYIRSVLSKDVTREPSIGEILDAFRDQVAGSGVSDLELDPLFSEAREESYRDSS